MRAPTQEERAKMWRLFELGLEINHGQEVTRKRLLEYIALLNDGILITQDFCETERDQAETVAEFIINRDGAKLMLDRLCRES